VAEHPRIGAEFRASAWCRCMVRRLCVAQAARTARGGCAGQWSVAPAPRSQGSRAPALTVETTCALGKQYHFLHWHLAISPHVRQRRLRCGVLGIRRGSGSSCQNRSSLPRAAMRLQRPRMRRYAKKLIARLPIRSEAVGRVVRRQPRGRGAEPPRSRQSGATRSAARATSTPTPCSPNTIGALSPRRRAVERERAKRKPLGPTLHVDAPYD
jgi:hypothetical protein